MKNQLLNQKINEKNVNQFFQVNFLILNTYLILELIYHERFVRYLSF